MKLLYSVLVGALALPGLSLADDPNLMRAAAVTTSELPAVGKADTSKISVSGLSSGGAMASQLSVAYSSRVEAVGIMAGQPYLCAWGSFIDGMRFCMTMKAEYFGMGRFDPLGNTRDSVKVDAAISYANDFEQRDDDTIDPLMHLQDQTVWISRGTYDRVVGPNATDAIATFYKNFNAQVVVDDTDSSPDEAPVDWPEVPHMLPSDKPGLDYCGDPQKEEATPPKLFVGSCGRDNIGIMFKALYRGNSGERGSPKRENLKSFSQDHYMPEYLSQKRLPQALSMAPEARVYIPEKCQQERCKVHVALHGCLQGADKAYEAFTTKGGYNEWAEAYSMIVLYPRVIDSNLPFNPAGCWDWWGYTPHSPYWLAYAQKGAPQMTAIWNMVDALNPAEAERRRLIENSRKQIQLMVKKKELREQW